MSVEFEAIMKLLENATDNALWVAVAYMVWRVLMVVVTISGAIGAIWVATKLVMQILVVPLSQSIAIVKRIRGTIAKRDSYGEYGRAGELYNEHFIAVGKKIDQWVAMEANLRANTDE